MNIKHSILTSLYLPLRVKNIVLKKFKRQYSPRLRVLLYHNIDLLNEAQFAAQIKWLKKTWKFIDLREFEAIINGHDNITEDSILLTFDDGFSSNRKIAENILNPLGIKALFFIISDFADLGDKDDFRQFISNGIFPLMATESIPHHWRNMNWGDLTYLLESGHSLGAHTATHARLSDLSTKELQKEIIDSANKIETKLGITIQHFAYTFGNLSSFSPEALELARKRFKYIHTGLRGDNALALSKWSIRRDAVTPKDPLFLVGSILEGGADWPYEKDLLKYESWGNG
ncbi:MAG: polysaccharide deacetylase family protein [Candidatus Marinimicrobia bacterium]|jgi:peptidoglycan/xylan/chitin deacetylase (PgdA/CDA1 family)|nr:polysaccharide deacetylase family protein [Candidatus Neomarinimicrobiota bacterium]